MPYVPQVDMIVTHQERRRSSGIHVAVVAPQVRSSTIIIARECSYPKGQEQGLLFMNRQGWPVRADSSIDDIALLTLLFFLCLPLLVGMATFEDTYERLDR